MIAIVIRIGSTASFKAVTVNTQDKPLKKVV